MFNSHRGKLLTTLVVLGALVAVSCTDEADSTAASTTTSKSSKSSTSAVETPRKDGLRGVRYCEVLLLREDAGNFQAEVWNTLGMNDCPQSDWEALDTTAIAKERQAAMALLNGPRYWTLDSITADIRATAPETTFGKLGMFRAATIDFGPNLPSQTPYTERSINRETVFGFDAGTDVYELVTPDKTVYVMQAFSQLKDPTLKATDLGSLGDRLALPEGWSYQVRTLDDALNVLSTDGVAVVIQDELQNTYQRVDAPS